MKANIPIKYQYEQITPGTCILVYTGLSHHKEEDLIRVAEMNERHPLDGGDFSGWGYSMGTLNHQGFYASQIIRFATKEEIAANPPHKETGYDTRRYIRPESVVIYDK